MTAPAREAAFKALHDVETRRADLPAALAWTRQALTDARDRALAADIVTGTLRWRALLDHVIQSAAGRPLTRLDAEVVDVLRLSVYQILKLERVPTRAAVNDAVELTRRSGKRSAAGFVNAVLRAVAAGRFAPPPAAPTGSHLNGAAREAWLDHLSVTLSQPRWLAERWLDRYGPEAAAAWARFNNTPAPITLRANRLKATREEVTEALERAGVTVRPSRVSPDGLVVVSGHPLATPIARQGVFVVQDEASQLVAPLLDARPGERILDACAAPGNKTTALAAAMNGHGLLVATDLRPRRLLLLQATITQCGATRVVLLRADVTRTLPFRPAAFDAVLLDAPCSGLGTIRRDPDIKWRRSVDQLARFAVAQGEMLAHAARIVRPGGRLVYATCSSEPEENENVVDAFLARHPEFRLTSRTAASLPPTVQTVSLEASGVLRTLPHVHGLEAFFAARLTRRAAP